MLCLLTMRNLPSRLLGLLYSTALGRRPITPTTPLNFFFTSYPATNFGRTWLNCLKQQNPHNFPRLLSYQITAAQGYPPFSPKWQCSTGRFRISRVLCVFFPFIFMCLISAEWPSLFNIYVDTKSGILCNFNPCNYYAHLYSCRIEMIFSGGSRIFLRGHQLPKWVC